MGKGHVTGGRATPVTAPVYDAAGARYETAKIHIDLLGQMRLDLVVCDEVRSATHVLT